MYIALVDAKVLNSQKMHEVQAEYVKRFGKERFPQFNYADFQRQGDKCSAQIYIETLEKCIIDGNPYNVPSKWVDVYDEYFKGEDKNGVQTH